MKKIPYGISNFQVLREKNYIYVDKTKYIEILENEAPYQFFVRPRRFGKSLFLSMLENYYDILKKDIFQSLFGDLYIGQNPTPERNLYMVLPLSFAGLVTSEGKDRFIKSFDDNIIAAVRDFLKKYSYILGDDNMPEGITGAEMAIRHVIYETARADRKLFILIDEYDNFANDLIGSGDRELYYELLSSEGYVRSFFKTIKDGTTKSVSRIFMTGVSPIMLDDLTSGFNITKNLTMYPNLNEMLGFTLHELETIISEIGLDSKLDKQTLLDDLELYYNGYLFSEDAKQRLYNTNMVLYFLDYLSRFQKYPKNILDLNIRTDYKKIESLAFNFEDQALIQKLIVESNVETDLTERFNLEYMYSNKQNLMSILYYIGMLTIEKAVPGKYIMKIPNYAIRTIYWDYFLDKLVQNKEIKEANSNLTSAIDEMAVEGKIRLFQAYIKRVLAMLSNRDLMGFDERYIKIILMTLFHQNGYYIVNSEYEVEHGYVDIYLSKNRAYADYIKYEWIIELKYIKENERNKYEEVKTKAIEQLKRYAASDKIKHRIDPNRLKKLLIIIIGKKDVFTQEVS
ncbi:MAG TPA: AAA family ATPase [Thermoanaerobacterales bacterium]|nr:AAA family ATPase [Thermoanaerobacterales bacterium]